MTIKRLVEKKRRFREKQQQEEEGEVNIATYEKMYVLDGMYDTSSEIFHSLIIVK